MITRLVLAWRAQSKRLLAAKRIERLSLQVFSEAFESGKLNQPKPLSEETKSQLLKHALEIELALGSVREGKRKPLKVPRFLRRSLRRFMTNLSFFHALMNAHSNLGAIVVAAGPAAPRALSETYEVLRRWYLRERWQSTPPDSISVVEIYRGTECSRNTSWSGNPNQIERISPQIWRHKIYGGTQAERKSSWETVKKATLDASGFVTSREGVQILDPGICPDNFYYRFQDKYFLTAEKGNFLAMSRGSKISKSVREAIFLPSRAPNNWFHFWAEIMPSAVTIAESFHTRMPVLVPELRPPFIEILRGFLPNPIVPVKETDLVSVDTLHYRGHALGTRDVLSPNHLQTLSSVDFELLQGLRKIVLGQVPSREDFPQKIFLKRNSAHRKLLNQSQLIREAKRHGFAVVSAEKLDWKEQISLFNSAGAVVGPGGAAMGSYLFAKPGATLVQTVAKQNILLAAPALLTRVAGANLYSLEGESRGPLKSPHSLQWHHSNYRVDPDRASYLFEEISSRKLSD